MDDGSKHLTAREFVLEGIRDAMLDGRILAGQELHDHSLANAFGVSRTPVREALKILEVQGFVACPRRFSKPIVTPISAERVEETYMMRIALEAIAVARACQVIDVDGLAALRRCAESGHEALRREDIQGWSQFNRDFHTRLAAYSKLPLLSRTTASLIDLSSFYSRLLWNELGDVLTRASEDHLRIVEACAERNPSLAARLVQEHLTASCSTQVKLARERELDLGANGHEGGPLPRTPVEDMDLRTMVLDESRNPL